MRRKPSAKLQSGRPDASIAGAERPLALLGNGPSLRHMDFAHFKDVDTLGMNAAYRYWREIDWHPTHYACLDDALIETHHEEILTMIREGSSESFFLSGKILDFAPELASDGRVRFLDEFVAHWHKERGESFSLAFHDAPSFRTDTPDLLTTGAYAARYAAYLGYRDIGLFGIDLRYTDIPEARELEDNRLVMARTPSDNPNYFFPGYQQAGDIFHVPNPTSHEQDLHLESFRALRDDFARNDVAVRITNTSATSRLVEEALFPFQDGLQFLGQAVLGAVIIPVTAAENDQLLFNLNQWAQPSGAPWLGPVPSRRPALIFVFNNSEAARAEARLRTQLEQLPHLRACFGALRFINLGLQGDADVYERSNRAKSGSQGLRAGPNNLFFGAMAAVRDIPGHSLFMETDCVVVKPGWLESANRMLSAGPLPWITGSIYLGADALGLSEMRHINGNALYASGDPAFQAFVEQVWKPHMAAVLEERPELPFDCMVEDLFQRADSRSGNESWQQAREIAHRMRYSPYIANLAGKDLPEDALATRVENVLAGYQETHFIHSRQLSNIYRQVSSPARPAEIRQVLAHMRGQPQDATARTQRAPGSPKASLSRRVKQRLDRLVNRKG